MKRVNPYIASVLSAAFLILEGCSDDTDSFIPEPTPTAIEIEVPEMEISGPDPITTLTIPQFCVSAFTKPDQWGGSTQCIMDNVVVTRTGLNKWSYSPAVNWPDYPVDFFATYPASVKVDLNPWWEHIIDNYSDPTNSTDLCVAVRMQSNQSDGRIRLNFKHVTARLLGSIKFSMDPRYQVRVKMARLKDFSEYGRFVMPRVTTDSKMTPQDLMKCWTTYTNTGTERILFQAQDDSYLQLTDKPYETVTGGLYFIPFDLEPETFYGSYAGTRLEIAYQIYDTETNQIIWPDKSVHYPFSWEDCVLSYIFLEDATPDGKWYPAVTYHYEVDIVRPTLEYPQQAKSHNPSNHSKHSAFAQPILTCKVTYPQ